jgi:hypothetical protein
VILRGAFGAGQARRSLAPRQAPRAHKSKNTPSRVSTSRPRLHRRSRLCRGIVLHGQFPCSNTPGEHEEGGAVSHGTTCCCSTPRVEAKTQRVGRDAQRRCGKPPLSNSEAMLGAVSAGRLPLKRGLARPGGRFRRFCAWRIFAGARAMINYVNLPSKERPHLRLRSVGSSLNLVEAPRRVLNSVHDRVGNLFGGHQSRKIGVGARHACKARRRRAAATPRTRP